MSNKIINLIIGFLAVLTLSGIYLSYNHRQATLALERSERFIENGSKYGWFIEEKQQKGELIRIELLSKWKEVVSVSGNEDLKIAIPHIKPYGISISIEIEKDHPARGKYEDLQEEDRIYFSLVEERKTDNWIKYLDPIY